MRAEPAPAAGDDLLVERDSGVVWVTFNRPAKKNALTAQMWSDLRMVIEEVGRRADDRVLVLTGAGDAFCAGADVGRSTGGTPDVRDYLPRMRAAGSCAVALHELPKPSVAAVNGAAVGAGCNLALGCDLIVADQRARFSEIFVQRALSIDLGGSWLLPRLVGLHKAKQLALLGDTIDAARAAELGLVNEVAPEGELRRVVGEMAARLAALPPLALSLTKRLLNQSFGVSLTEAVEAECVAQAVNRGSPDALEASRAFVERRPPVFGGEASA